MSRSMHHGLPKNPRVCFIKSDSQQWNVVTPETSRLFPMVAIAKESFDCGRMPQSIAGGGPLRPHKINVGRVEMNCRNQFRLAAKPIGSERRRLTAALSFVARPVSTVEVCWCLARGVSLASVDHYLVIVSVTETAGDIVGPVLPAAR